MSSRIVKVIACAAVVSGVIAAIGAIQSGRAAAGSLVAAYAFNEGAGTILQDLSGNGNAGTISNATWTSEGKFGGALVFNGTSARVSVLDSSSLHLSSGMTLEAWVNPSSVSSAWRDVIYKGNDNYYLMGASDHGGVPGGGGTFGATNVNAFAASALPTNSWSYLATTYDGANMRLYVNGTLVASQARTGAITASTNPLTIGSDPIWGQYFSGLIDEVRIYNQPLSVAAIQTDMTIPIGSIGSSDTQPPSTPTGLATGAVGQTSMTLSWIASNDNVGVTGYRLYLGDSQVGTSVSTSYPFSGLTCGTSYTLGVAAVDRAGNVSGISTVGRQTAACSDTQPPSSPGTLSASAASSSEVDLSWAPASDNVGITGYQILRCQGAGCISFSLLTQQPGTGTTYKDTSLSARTSYSYQVRAVDAAGNLGPYSNTTSATTQARTVGLVAAYSFDEKSGASVGDSSGNGNTGTISNATWTSAGKFGGALVFNGTSARVSVPSSASLQLSTGMTLEAWVNPTTVSSGWRDVIEKGNDNYYLMGTSDHSSFPGGGGTFGGTKGRAFAASPLPTNSWTYLATSYDSANLRLYVNGTLVATQAKTGAITSSTNALTIGSDPFYGQYFSGMIDDLRIYNTAVTATQIQADMRAPVAALAPDTTAPGAPTGLTATFVTQSAATLSWSASTDNIGVVGYHLYVSGVGVGTTVSTSYAFSGFSCGTNYTLGVDAYDAAGNRSAVSTRIVTTSACADTSPPAAPTNLAESASTTTSITATWTASTDNVGVTGYRVFLDGTLAGSPVTTSFTFSGLACGTSHQVVVDAHDAAGNNSPQASATMAATACPPPPPGDTTPPSTPTGLAVSSGGQTTLALSWNASSDNVAVTGYGVYRNGTLAGSPIATSYTLSGLSCGTSYTVAVDAADAAGNRSAKATITASTAACLDTQAPTVPSGVALATRTTTSISIGWTASSDNVGVAGYHLYLAGTAVGTATSTSYTFTGLTCNTNYTLGVDAYDAAGNKSAQATTAISTSACPDTTPPSTPTGLATSAIGQTSMTLAWTAATDNVAVTGYRLYVNGTQVGTSTVTNYAFSGLTCGTSYPLGVAAVDAAGNVSGTAAITAATAACSGSGGAQFSGPFNCYGADPACYTPKTCDTTITSGLATAISNAAAGSTICLRASGSPYASLSTSATKSSDVTIQPYPGEAVTISGLNLTGTNHLVFQGFTIAGANTAGITNTQITHSTFTGSLYMCEGTTCGGAIVQNANTLIDYDRFDNLNTALYDGRLTVRGQDGGQSISGITISHSHFGNGGCTDGVFFNGNGNAVVGPGNEFEGFLQGPCNGVGAHVDPIQFYGETKATITGNYFHDNGDGSGGLESFNGDENATATNNVFVCTCTYPHSISSLDGPNWTISHNTFVGGGDIFNDRGTGTLTGNAWINGGGVSSPSAYTNSYNLNSGTSGTGNMSGAAILVSSPASGYYHYQLAAGSPGYHALPNGTSIGISP